MTSAAGQKPVRKFPPPCWTRDEALVLIEAYRERWYALHRAFLRTPDWDAVAETVATTCPDVTPPKTSAQCRHKMEKLRQRHRAEKQRAAAFSGDCFFSTWPYYEPMEAMENGSNPKPNNNNNNPGHGIKVKPVKKFATLAPNPTKQRTKPNPNFRSTSYPNNSSNQDNDYVYGIRIKPSITPIEESGRPGLRPRKFSKVVNDNDNNDDGDDGGEMWMKVPRSTNSARNGENLKKGRKNNGGIVDVARSIRLLGEGFMKVEKMKMDMVREIEEMRMETEMKRNEMMIESQKQIVDAFVKGVIESRKMMPATMADM